MPPTGSFTRTVSGSLECGELVLYSTAVFDGGSDAHDVIAVYLCFTYQVEESFISDVDCHDLR